MTETDEVMIALETFGKTALKVKAERDILMKALVTIREILRETEDQISEAQP